MRSLGLVAQRFSSLMTSVRKFTKGVQEIIQLQDPSKQLDPGTCHTAWPPSFDVFQNRAPDRLWVQILQQRYIYIHT